MGKRHLLDDIALLLASSMPRRQALRALIGMLAGSALTLLGAREADAAGCLCLHTPPNCKDPIGYGFCRAFCFEHHHQGAAACTTCCTQCLTLC